MASKMSLKLMVDKNRNKVLFAKAGKDFVDFLFSLLTLPVGTLRPSDCKGNGKAQSDKPMKPIYYRCRSITFNQITKRNFSDPCHNYVTDVKGSKCIICEKFTMTTELHFGVMTYMITDDLEVKPKSTISSIAILNKRDVKDIGALEDTIWLELLRTSLQSKPVLTDVFLNKRNKRIKTEP
ncbi:hypothetical protein NE237_012392 [Protea cynaroides]|uniref:Uncharacterized protein n=1 Tax=Protea cynaroides TaxID=273540 RepID=A0A9Q0JWU9_9MAGN|nr:hypothetical protein NE237_012392 [Protea cynaroides]